MHIPILAVNTDKEIWGDGAGEFIPERWEHIPDAASSIPGVWANHFSFFFAGPNNCESASVSGSHYSSTYHRLCPMLSELTVLLFTLILEFEPGTPTGGIIPKAAGLVYRPSVLGEEKGSGLLLIVKPYNA
ncbi:hypothetical protein B0H11DRAFT_2343493 [Mycena galericulata]|nr:hypothetical protein B0H11DRAFT_2343493 [Mycena galericulata]